MGLIKDINVSFSECFKGADGFLKAKKTSELDRTFVNLIHTTIPGLLSQYISDKSYKVDGSVGKGLKATTPWIAILDTSITTSTKEGVYLVFLFSKDLKQVYLTLNQGTTKPNSFGPRLTNKEIKTNSESLRNALQAHQLHPELSTDGAPPLGDKKYCIGSVYYTLWDVHDESKSNDLLQLYLSIYRKYAKRSPLNSTSFTAQTTFPMPSAKTVNLFDYPYRRFITAIKSKPFLLLAGISGTGKSRLARELARACWEESSDEYKAHKPRNFEMIQVKPNWHDSSELIGYISRISEERFIVGPFLKFMAKAIQDPNVPYFLCLDEMNLAPVEQYFAEFLSVIESRKVENGIVVTDPLIDYEKSLAYKSLINQLFPDNKISEDYLSPKDESQRKFLSIPPNLIIIGTVNMDESTYSFSRKVLDRAMSIEMNEVDLERGLKTHYEPIGKISYSDLIGKAVEGVDVYEKYTAVCDIAISYLNEINKALEGTPFKIAYRTRNEFLLYVINNLPYNKDNKGNDTDQRIIIARALDEITSMKVLSRIEGDESKVNKKLLSNLSSTIKDQLKAISNLDYAAEQTISTYLSVSIAKLKEMENRLESGFTSFWS